ncbi:putative P-loop containing nucleoside triphosphate hydrolase [Medicago truncatula]|uniref:Putative P-loop containing nucleoside triphosphate hydrolase n=1 Tax=Medicago truncatula TaxID=3880 RepID=A0A396GY46_MEDTR|nr:putative P-loop containing nucleoside triphosphate hydrolase [Medicago truncatula]
MDLNANIGLTFTPIEWGNEQKHILSAIPQGKSVFITGSAGTGKTLLLEEKNY